jgi:DNA polymerase-3 subunit alpha
LPQAVKILVDEIIPIEKAEETWAASIHFNLEISRTERETLSNLHAILERHPGSCPGFLHLRSPDKTDLVIALPETLRLKAGTILTREVHNFLGYQAVETHCRPVTASAGNNGPNRNGRDRRPPNGGYRR